MKMQVHVKPGLSNESKGHDNSKYDWRTSSIANRMPGTNIAQALSIWISNHRDNKQQKCIYIITFSSETTLILTKRLELPIWIIVTQNLP